MCACFSKYNALLIERSGEVTSAQGNELDEELQNEKHNADIVQYLDHRTNVETKHMRKKQLDVEYLSA